MNTDNTPSWRPFSNRYLSTPVILLATAVLAVVVSLTAAHAMSSDGDSLRSVEAAPQEESPGSHPIAGLPQPVPQQPQSLIAPPPGGLTLGFAGTTSPDAVVDAQTFDVDSITVIDRSTQAFLVYIPGAPVFVNTLTDQVLTQDTVVIIRRTGSAPASPNSIPRAQSGTPLEGTPFTFASPPSGGLTMGMSGTNNLDGLIGAQSFEVTSVSLFHVASQRWLVYIPGAPSIVNTLTSGLMTPDSFVALRRAGDVVATVSKAADEEPEPESAPKAEAEAEEDLRSLGVGRISYYYCQKGSNSAAWGDGGGWCGAFASGKAVYEGGASCAAEYRGQRFKIAGDPTDRVYVCEDIGGAVHGNTRDIFFHNSDDASRWIRVVGYEAEIFVVE